MSLKEKIALRLKAKATGVNLSQKRIDAIVLRAEKGLTDESDDTAIDANLDLINDITPFKEIASFDDHNRAKEAKTAQEKEAARLKAIEEGKAGEVELPTDAPEWFKAYTAAQAIKDAKRDADYAAIQGEKAKTTRREQYAKVLEGKSPEYIASELKKYDRMSFKDDDDFTSTLADFTQEVANSGLSGDQRPNGGAGSPLGGTKQASAAEVDAAVNAII